MLTPSDLVNPKRKSGFNHVNSARGGSQPGVANGRKPRWRGERGRSKGTVGPAGGRSGWRGPSRSTALEAAQDYCDYVNGNNIAAAQPLKTAGHQYTQQRRKVPSDIQAARGMIRDWEAQQKGAQGYIYLIIEDLPGGELVHGKIGYSVNPHKRVAELQTGNPRTLRLHAMKPGTEADERALHAKYIKQNVLQEWFSLTKELLLEWDAKELVK